jgi:heavy metal sensor kinase
MNLNINWPKKISWKLTLVYAIIFILVLVILNGSVYLILSNFVERNIRASLDKTLNFILPKIKGVDKQSFNQYEAEFLKDISQSEGDMYFRILDYNKDVVAQSNILLDMKIPIKDGYTKLNNKDREFVSKTVLFAKFGLLNGYLQIVRDVTIENDFLDKLLTALIIASIVGGIGAIFVGYLITKKSLKPIKNMTETAQKISGTDLKKRLEVSGPEDELNNLAHTFNSMLERLEKAFNRQEQFVSDASHELRTPISVIKGYINLLDRWGKNKEEIRDEAIGAIKNETENMNKLIENLLFLARGDLDEIVVNKEKINLNMVFTELSKETKMIAKEREISFKEKEKIVFWGDRKLIKQLIRIFIDNSLKYTSTDGKIWLQLEKEDNNIVIIISDDGCGIPQEEITHIFERFYRVDKSRSSNSGGTGLGLSIAKTIIDLHKGEIQISSKVKKGTNIKIYFPMGGNNYEN